MNEQRNRMLIVDGSEVNRATLREIFADSFRIAEASDGKTGWEAFLSYRPQVMLLDVGLPGAEGWRVLAAVGKDPAGGECSVVAMAPEGGGESEERALRQGAAAMIRYPFQPALANRRVLDVWRARQYVDSLEGTIREQRQLIARSYRTMLDTLSGFATLQDGENGGHLLKAEQYTRVLLTCLAQDHPSLRMRGEAIDLIARAAMLRDIGKTAINPDVLNKVDPLTAEDQKVIRSHVEEGCRLLESFKAAGSEFLHYTYSICRHHHERWDGKGYPDGLSGEDIPLSAMVVGIVDAYDGLTSRRPYKPAFTHAYAVRMILNGECGVFSQEVLDCFAKVADQFEQILLSPEPDPAAAQEEIISRLSGVLTLGLRQTARDLADAGRLDALLDSLDIAAAEIDLDAGEATALRPGGFRWMPAESVPEEKLIADVCACAEEPDKAGAFLRRSLKALRRPEENSASDTLCLRGGDNAARWFRVTLCAVGGADAHHRALLIVRDAQHVHHLEEMAVHTAERNRDLLRAQQEMQSLRQRAESDPLTGLNNRVTAQNRVCAAIAENGGGCHGLMLVDIDDFKDINDTYGHMAGDRTLCRLSQVFTEMFRQRDVIARVGGDEFLVFMQNVPGPELIRRRAERLVETVRRELADGAVGVPCTISLGVAVYPADGTTFQTLYSHADQALYAAKKHGKNRCSAYGMSGEGQASGVTGTPTPAMVQDPERFAMALSYRCALGEPGEAMMNQAMDDVARQLGLRLLLLEAGGAALRWQRVADASGDADEDALRTLEQGCADQPVYVPGGDGAGRKAACVPVLHGKERIGCVAALADGGGAWSEAEKDALELLAHLYGRRLWALGLEREARDSAALSRALMEAMPQRAYMVDGAFTVREMSRLQRQAYPDAAGGKCYRAFYGLGEPCAACPVLRLPLRTERGKAVPLGGESGACVVIPDGDAQGRTKI